MANPNIVNVTSIYGESIGEALTTTVGTDILTVAADVVLKINYISVTNTHGTAATDVTVGIRKVDFTSAGIASTEDNAGIFLLASTVSVPADDVFVVLNTPIYMMSGDILEAGSSVVPADIFISYEVINDA